MDKRTVTLDEVASALGIGRNTAYVLARRDEFPVPVIRLGRRLVVPREALEEVLETRKTTPEVALEQLITRRVMSGSH